MLSISFSSKISLYIFFFFFLFSSLSNSHQITTQRSDVPQAFVSLDWNPYSNKLDTADLPVVFVGKTPISTITGPLVENRKDGIIVSDTSVLKVSNGIVLSSSYTIDVHIYIPHQSENVREVLIAGKKEQHIVCQHNFLGSILSDGSFSSSTIDISTLKDGWHRVTAVYDTGITTWYIDYYKNGTSKGTPQPIYYIGNAGEGKSTYSFGSPFAHVRIYNEPLSAEQIKNGLRIRDQVEAAALKEADLRAQLEQSRKNNDIKKAVKVTVGYKDQAVDLAKKSTILKDKFQTHYDTSRGLRKGMEDDIRIVETNKDSINRHARAVDEDYRIVKGVRIDLNEIKLSDAAAEKRLLESIQHAIELRKELNNKESKLLNHKMATEKNTMSRAFTNIKLEQSQRHRLERRENKVLVHDDMERQKLSQERLAKYLQLRKDRILRLQQSQLDQLQQSIDLEKSLTESRLQTDRITMAFRRRALVEQRKEKNHYDDMRRRKLEQEDQDRQNDLEQELLENQRAREHDELLRQELLAQQDQGYQQLINRAHKWMTRQQILMAKERLNFESKMKSNFDNNQIVREEEQNWRNKMYLRLQKLQDETLKIQEARKQLLWNREQAVSGIQARKHTESLQSLANCVKIHSPKCCEGIEDPKKPLLHHCTCCKQTLKTQS